MKLRDPFEREGEKLNLSALLVHAIISKLKGKKKIVQNVHYTIQKVSFVYDYYVVKKKGILEYSLSLYHDTSATSRRKYLSISFVNHILIIQTTEIKKVPFSEQNTASYKKENFYLLCPLFSQHPNKIYCREGERN